MPSIVVALVLLLSAAIPAGAACPSGSRALTFVNRCGSPLWVGAVGNRGASCTTNAECAPNEYCDTAITQQCTFMPLNGSLVQTDTACSTNAGCPADQFCYTLTGSCVGLPADGNGWELADETPMEVCAPTPWEGRFWPRTGCTFSGGTCGAAGVECCTTGNCLGEDNRTFSASCRLSAVPPATLAELAMLAYPTTDTYDVSNVDGYTLPVSLAPTAGTFDSTPPPGTFYEPWCGSPGCVKDCGETAPCTWTLDVTVCPEQMRFVTPQPCATSAACPTAGSTCSDAGICTCGSDADCGTGQVCGTSPLGGGTRTCGQYVGCYSAAKACAADPSMGAPLSCSAHQDLYGCTGSTYGNSCYTDGIGDGCCGCPSWSPDGTCNGTNATWTALAETTPLPPATVGFAKVFHDACPSAYAYQYDDKIGDFTCLGKSAAEQPGYTVTFCPGGAKHGGACTTAADCADDDPCTTESCVAGSCVGTPATGLAAATCVCERAAPGVCAASVPRKLARLQQRICRRLGRVEVGEDGRDRRILKRAARQFRHAEKLARKLARRGKIDAACAGALEDSLGDASERARDAERDL